MDVKLDKVALDAFLREAFPEAFHDGAGLSIERVGPGQCLMRQRYHPAMLRPGGTVSGPVLMALADYAMYGAILSAIGPVGLAVTTSLTINFLRKAPAGADLLAEATLMKLGRRLAVGEVGLRSAGSAELAAHVTATYSLPPVAGEGVGDR